ncbi:hypothetical protein PIROE2DRAFT_17190 [Piromyces sp. E2]|nr:hypothetical protein PIROE2DRAFT_17190 [Piromyces sp. E2]|eukprot:OUM57732.1 hypothetical protein PIROE2DRAFT_17190 [Piromyces sp. E2]
MISHSTPYPFLPKPDSLLAYLIIDDDDDALPLNRQNLINKKFAVIMNNICDT